MDKKLIGLMSVFLLSFALFLSLVFLNTTIARNSRASANLQPSADTSFILAFPLDLASTSNEPSALTVFVRAADTKPLPERMVTFNTTLGLINQTSVPTDSDGKATAQFTCNSASGIAEISAIIDSTLNISKTVTVKCN